MSDETWVVALPKLGETVTEGVIGSIFKQVGDVVAFDDPLFEVATDKVDSEIPSPYDGVVVEYVHPSTLKALIKEGLKAGREFPEDKFKISPFTRASIVKR